MRWSLTINRSFISNLLLCKILLCFLIGVVKGILGMFSSHIFILLLFFSLTIIIYNLRLLILKIVTVNGILSFSYSYYAFFISFMRLILPGSCIVQWAQNIVILHILIHMVNFLIEFCIFIADLLVILFINLKSSIISH